MSAHNNNEDCQRGGCHTCHPRPQPRPVARPIAVQPIQGVLHPDTMRSAIENLNNMRITNVSEMITPRPGFYGRSVTVELNNVTQDALINGTGFARVSYDEGTFDVNGMERRANEMMDTHEFGLSVAREHYLQGGIH
jgi:hypothetical protein